MPLEVNNTIKGHCFAKTAPHLWQDQAGNLAECRSMPPSKASTDESEFVPRAALLALGSASAGLYVERFVAFPQDFLAFSAVAFFALWATWEWIRKRVPRWVQGMFLLGYVGLAYLIAAPPVDPTIKLAQSVSPTRITIARIAVDWKNFETQVPVATVFYEVKAPAGTQIESVRHSRAIPIRAAKTNEQRKIDEATAWDRLIKDKNRNPDWKPESQPGGIFSIMRGIPFSAKGVIERGIDLYLVGIIDYRDALGPKPSVEFCVRAVPNSEPIKCSIHNTS